MVLSMLLNQGCNLAGNLKSAKILLLTGYTFAFFMFAHYGAILTSTIVVEPTANRIKSFKEAADAGIRIIVTEDSSHELGLKNAPIGSPMSDLYSNDPLFVSSSFEAGDMLREKDDQGLMYFGATPSMIEEQEIVSYIHIFMVLITETIQTFFFYPKTLSFPVKVDNNN